MEADFVRLTGGGRMPQLGLGTWRLKGQKCTHAVNVALRMGYKHIDTAEMYGNHADIAKALQSFDRKKIFITSKLWVTNFRRGDALDACNRALSDLNTEYLDLYLMHWPNPAVPVSETLGAMAELADAGKIKSIGVSNFDIGQLEDALGSGAPISANQVEFHPGLYRKSLLEFCKKKGISVTAYSPLGRGGLLDNKTITSIARKIGKTPSQVCLRWSVQHGLVVIPKASSETHLKENTEIFGWKLPKSDMDAIDSMGLNGRAAARKLAGLAIGTLGVVGAVLHR